MYNRTTHSPREKLLYRLVVLALLLGLVAMPGMAADNNVHLYGALVAEPCVVALGDDEIEVDFGTILDKDLYQHTRTLGKPFEIRLTECDLSIGKAVKVSFVGTENPVLPGLLAVADASEASGIAVGLETPEGHRYPINKPGKSLPLQEGDTVIAIKAYVQGEAQAISEQSIVRGGFMTTATFNLEYE